MTLARSSSGSSGAWPATGARLSNGLSEHEHLHEKRRLPLLLFARSVSCTSAVMRGKMYAA
eukprot:6427405-Pyramimonas_sp.AAC.1